MQKLPVLKQNGVKGFTGLRTFYLDVRVSTLDKIIRSFSCYLYGLLGQNRGLFVK